MSDKAILRVVGPLSVELSDGTDLTPKGRRAKALLALLALSPKAVRTRRWLQDKLWSDRPQDQGAASLRQELSGVRRHFREAGIEPIRADRELVRLDLEQIVLLPPEPDGRSGAEELLEGLDVGDPEFEDWLREQRSRWSLPVDVSSRPAAPIAAATPSAPVPPAVDGRSVDHPIAVGSDGHRARPLIVVQGFSAIGSSERAELFARGLSDEMLTVLGALSGTIVTKKYEDRTPRPAGYTLTGHVREGDRLRITAQLFSIDTGTCLWTGRYDYGNDASFDAQEEIARRVVEAAQIQLSDGEWARIWSDTATSLRAWECFQRGRVMEAQVRREALQQARRCYRDALFHDPHYTPAMVSLAFCLVDEIRLGWSANSQAARQEAWALHNRARESQPGNVYARALEAFLACIDGRHDHACSLMQDLVQIAPESPELIAYYGVLRSYNSQLDEAILLFEHALRLTPHPPGWISTNLALAYLLNDDPRATGCLEAALRANPENVRAHVGMVVVAVRCGDPDRTRHWAARLRELEPQFKAENWRSRVCFRDPTIHEHIAAELRRAGL